jgi:hypothetical protein
MLKNNLRMLPSTKRGAKSKMRAQNIFKTVAISCQNQLTKTFI